MRTATLALLGGILAATGAVFTARTYRLSREGQITERYSRAIELLGSTELERRLGGIYALERVSRDSDADHQRVVDVLTAYVRARAPHRAEPSSPESMGSTTFSELETGGTLHSAERAHTGAAGKVRPATDIQAVMTVLGRRNLGHRKARATPPLNLHSVDLRGVDLTEAELRGVDLADANLEGATLVNAEMQQAKLPGARLDAANLRNARFDGAELPGATLEEAILHGAHFPEAVLSEARLIAAKLQDARLASADLSGASLSRADLGGTDLSGATLSRANLVDAFNLERAKLDGADLSHAVLPANFAPAQPTGDLTGATYEQLRREMAPGPARTAELEALMARARLQARSRPLDSGVNLETFRRGTAGDRIFALALMQEHPLKADPKAAIEAIQAPRSAFEQYHGLRLADQMLPLIDEESRREICDVIEDELKSNRAFAEDSDREHLARRILANCVDSSG